MSLVEKLYKKYNEGDNDFLLSPYSIHMALAMVKEGARGLTVKELDELLGPDPRVVDIQTVKTANAVWLRYSAEKKWKQKVETKYKGEVRDIRGIPEPAPTINAWVSSKTNNKIEKILELGQLTEEDKLVVTNAVHFKDYWSSQFKKGLTKKDPFYTSETESELVDMMHLPRDEDKKIEYYADAYIQAIKLAYLRDSVSLVIVLPWKRTGTIPSHILAGIMTQKFNKIPVTVFLPKFIMRHTYSLKQDLMEIGLSTAFTDDADFSGIYKGSKNDDYLKIDDVIHKTFIDVDEKGTEAAAVTGIPTRMMAMQEPAEFRADHPFTFYIEHLGSRHIMRSRKQTILFIGAVKTPPKYN